MWKVSAGTASHIRPAALIGGEIGAAGVVMLQEADGAFSHRAFLNFVLSLPSAARSMKRKHERKRNEFFHEETGAEMLFCREAEEKVRLTFRAIVISILIV